MRMPKPKASRARARLPLLATVPAALALALALVPLPLAAQGSPQAAPQGVARGAAGAAAEDVAETPTASDLPRRVIVRFVTEGDYPPFNFLDEDGALAGFNVDLARAVCLELSTACDIKVRPWSELFLSLKRGEADAVVAGHAVTAQALTQVDFSERYFFTPGRFVARRGTLTGDVTPESLEGKRIGVAKASAHDAFARQFFRSSAVQSFENADLARDALVQGKVDALFDDGISLSFWLNGTLSRQCCEFVGGPFLEPRFFGDGIAIAVAKNDPQMRQLINTALKRVRESGRLDELVQRYFPFRVY